MGTLADLTRNPDLAGFVILEIGLQGGIYVLFIKHNTTGLVRLLLKIHLGYAGLCADVQEGTYVNISFQWSRKMHSAFSDLSHAFR